MASYAFWRLGRQGSRVFGVLTIVFVIMRFSGDPTLLLVPEGASRACRRAASRARLRSSRSGAILRLSRGPLASGFRQFGRSTNPGSGYRRQPHPLYPHASRQRPLIAFAVGVPTGVAMAVWRGRAVERISAGIVLTGREMYQRFCPAFSSSSSSASCSAGCPPRDRATPRRSSCLQLRSALSMSTFARMARIAVVDELSDYVRAGRARGLSPAVSSSPRPSQRRHPGRHHRSA